MTEERKQFEEWAKMFGAQPDLTKANGGANYSDSIIDIAWLAWRASRAAQPASPALKLPEKSSRGDADVVDVGFINGWNACLDEVKRLNAPHTAPIEPICATGGSVKLPFGVEVDEYHGVFLAKDEVISAIHAAGHQVED